MGLQAKKLAIIAEIKDVPKTGFNANQNYPYHKEGDIIGAIKPLLVKYGVVITPSLSWDNGPAVTKDGNLTTVYTKYTITDVETGESEIEYWGGQGADNQDKGMNKAFTASGKYFLIKYFQLESDEDADAGEAPTTAPKQASRTVAPPPPQAPSNRELRENQIPKVSSTGNSNFVVCESCNERNVPPGVANFSKNNFNGHIYCMPCQKKQVRENN